MMPMQSCDHTAYMDYMDPDVRSPQKAVKLYHSLTHCSTWYIWYMNMLMETFWHLFLFQ